VDRSGAFAYTHEIEVEVATVPRRLALGQNYPNPFNPSTTMTFAVPAEGHVNLDVYDLLGRHVERLVGGAMMPGVYSVTWNADGVPSGVYVVRLSAGGVGLTQKVILAK
jgi:hypothetical protein